jgi:pyroglutamyl-peptidase
MQMAGKKAEKRLLVTGFAPFGGQRINPSWICVEELPEAIAGVTIIRRELPVVWFAAVQELYDLLGEYRADAVLCVGQAGGTAKLNIERVAINLCNGTDNDGRAMDDAPIFVGGPAAYFATLPVAAMKAAVEAEDIGVTYSFSAGTYLCNHVMYAALHRAAIEMPGLRAGFLHVPMLPEQVKDTGGYSMPLEKTRRGVYLCAEAVAKGIV